MVLMTENIKNISQKKHRSSGIFFLTGIWHLSCCTLNCLFWAFVALLSYLKNVKESDCLCLAL